MGKLTIRTVAKLANVSATTVSRVMGGDPHVSFDTRQRVLRAVKKTGYFPDSNARAMVKKQTKTVGVCISNVSNPFFPPIIRGIENTVNKFGYSVILCNNDDDSPKEEQYLRVLLEKRVDGLIISPTNSRVPFLETFEAKKIPIVCVDRFVENVHTDTVAVDNVHGTFVAVEHLIKLGHKRIGIITGRKGITTTSERIKGYFEALDRYGVDKDRSLIVEGYSTVEGGIKTTRTLFELKSPPTAVFSGNNQMTIGLFLGLKELKRNIPKDVAVIGFDDLEWCRILDPPLTVVSQPTYAIGSTAAQLLMQRLLNEGPREKQSIVLRTTFIIRNSC